MKKEKAEVTIQKTVAAELMILLAEAFHQIGQTVLAGVKGCKAALENGDTDDDKKDNEPDAPEGKEAGAVELPAIDTLKSPEVKEIGKALGLKGAVTKAILTTIRAILDKSFDVEEASKAELIAVADALEAPHKKSMTDQVSEIKAALKKLQKTVEITIVEPEEDKKDEDAEKPAGKKSVVSGKKDEDEDADKDNDDAKPEAGSGDKQEKEFTKLAEAEVGEELDEEQEKEYTEQLEEWFALEKDGNGGEMMAKARKLLKKGDVRSAAIIFISAFLGQEDGEYVTKEWDEAYLRGDEDAWCNGAPLEATDDDEVGRDFATGTLWTMNDEGEFVKKEAKKKIGKK